MPQSDSTQVSSYWLATRLVGEQVCNLISRRPNGRIGETLA